MIYDPSKMKRNETVIFVIGQYQEDCFMGPLPFSDENIFLTWNTELRKDNMSYS